MSWNTVHDGREAFLACMRAFCAPGTPVELPARPRVCTHPELDCAAAILLGLLDRGLALAVSGPDPAPGVAARVMADTGAGCADIPDADWVLVHGPAADAVARARRGTRLAPESGATLVVASNSTPIPVTIAGPGVAAPARVLLPLDAVTAHALIAANSAPPLGVDLLITTANCVIGLPRSVALEVA
ncbi:carbon-phosphorus lyase complex subunit [Mycolicibacterium phlei]|jgi:alpha-D-ribose 1-methylphosphonate 5-triphosphate synthase subunit PhnH|uniref:Phosphonate C-P lyase system protein PhnH n=1 Tax=Mycolicibacterium phlei DSM 43239 = CCUG 21000 TaxID=1226750 RepID=A0A5N5UZD2_MYCPH|nr:phosphonate C-P lyase system protein PhnH [Mycolicibacterium phlei]VEG09189.1 carbon-phosphorus lyase complex subunit [Mycobacteroides chelonae]AMO61073.1 Alpha-D-ribose 1-methylphosphonate 5-triphosphate synthase subunit PhnH [Mycolicibacterium phlei]EID08960.1 hypothetical protein MPHLEI_27277 [Mycolicibacterium phlei RIVM601174]KAB7754991.1 phosphonate C-P lyase system protein PhnH [Mycolicibacterium phlei DSM 43239 = CCUG 21000]KXW64047.1 phosphonate C-P lyase system protein PhnH [Mycol